MGDTSLSKENKPAVRTVQQPFKPQGAVVQKETTVQTSVQKPVVQQKPGQVTVTKTVTTMRPSVFSITRPAEEKKQLLTIGIKGAPAEAKKPGETMLEPVVRERRLWNMSNIIIAFVIGAVLVAVEFISVPAAEMSPFGAAMLGLILLVIYAVILFFLLEPKILREVFQTTVRTLEKPVLKEVVVEKPVVKEVVKEVYVEKPVVRTVEKPVTITRTITKPVVRTVTKNVVRTVEKPVIKYRFKPRVKLNIPKYAYTGSTETKVYHTTNCRLGKLIKRKYALHSNSVAFFRARKFRPCTVCVLKSKKV